MPAYDSSFAPSAPIAIVVIRATDSSTVENVRLLIDSGADITLLPRRAVEQLGVHLDPSLRYDLKGFDGAASSAQAVDLDMLFLRKAFRGRYLLTDEETGVLGRDVLASVRILLDGPAEEWSEAR